MGHFCPPGSGSGSGIRIQIRIHWPGWIRIQSGSGSETLELSINKSRNFVIKIFNVSPNLYGGAIKVILLVNANQGFGSVFIWSWSGSGSSVWGWKPTRRIRIQGFNDQKLKKNYSWKKIKIFFWSKTAIYLSLVLHEVCPNYRRSLQLTKEAIQHLKTWTLKKNSTFVGHFCPPGSGSTGPIESGSNPDPDPKPWIVNNNSVNKARGLFLTTVTDRAWGITDNNQSWSACCWSLTEKSWPSCQPMED